MKDSGPLLWLVDIEAYNFETQVFKGADIRGRVLIASSQLWSIIREEQVLSILIGPGYFKGRASKNNIEVDIGKHLFAIMFDPTALRYDEPIPLVDIINPEVIDPMGVKKREEIVALIKDLVVEKGNILTGDTIASIKGEGRPPTVAHYKEMMKRLSVSLVSGVQRAKFILGGTNRPLYQPLVEGYNGMKYSNIERLNIMAIAFSRFTNYADIDVMSDWMIVEKAGMGGTGTEAIREEYDSVLQVIENNLDKFIFEL